MSLRKGLVHTGVYLFLVAVIVMLPANIIYGENGVRWVSVFMVYPGLLLILGTVAFSDAWELILGFTSPQRLSRDHVLPVAFLAGRGICFTLLFVGFLGMLIKAAD